MFIIKNILPFHWNIFFINSLFKFLTCLRSDVNPGSIGKYFRCDYYHKTNFLLQVHGGTLFRAISEAADGIEKNLLKVSIECTYMKKERKLKIISEADWLLDFHVLLPTASHSSRRKQQIISNYEIKRSSLQQKGVLWFQVPVWVKLKLFENWEEPVVW